MKTYMNRIDREHHLMILIAWDYLGSWLEKTSCLTKDERKRIKTATTHLLHASDSIVSRIFEMTEQVPVLGPDHRRKMAQSV
jgi:hypothetical protein